MLSAGLLSLYRAYMKSTDFTKIEVKIVEKKIEPVSTYKGSPRYGMTFKTENSATKFGIYIGTNSRPSDNNLFNVIDTTKTYRFFIDPTVSTANGINLGVREIYFNGKRIFKESQKLELFLGIAFTLLGAGGLFIITKFRRPGKAR